MTGHEFLFEGLFEAFREAERNYDASNEQAQPDMNDFDFINLVQGEDGVWSMPAQLAK